MVERNYENENTDKNMKNVVVNGANGYVGSNFVQKLLKDGYSVVALVRANDKESPKARMMQALREKCDDEEVNTDRLRVYEYSLLEKEFDLSESVLKEIFQGDVEYFHFAASLKFDARSREEIFDINVEGVRNSMDVFLRYASEESRFFFISTAYTCGKTEEKFEERFYENADISQFRNYYEQSKRFAENLVKEYIEEKNLRAHILRLSQVVGNNKTGVTKTDYGIFDFVKRVHNLAQRYPGITIRIQVDPFSNQNLIPIDMVVDFLTRTIETAEVPDIINLVSKNPVQNQKIIRSIDQLVPISILPREKVDKQQMNSLEKVVAAGMSFTSSYIDTRIDFDTKNRDIIMNSHSNEVSEDSVHSMIVYYLEHQLKNG